METNVSKKVKLNIREATMAAFLGVSLGSLTVGIFFNDNRRMYMFLAYCFLALAWAYREMDLGWNTEEKNWSFVKKEQIDVHKQM